MKTEKKKIWTNLVLASLFLAALAGGCKKDNFKEISGVCPEVESTNPASEAVNIPLDIVIDVTFNEKMNAATVTPAAFTLTGPATKNGQLVTATKVEGSLTYNEATNTMSFNPTDNLEPNTVYTGTVKTVVKDLRGAALQTNYVWSFTTGLPPTVISTFPQDEATGVSINSRLSATFSMAMDSLSITSSTFTLKQGNLSVSGTVTSSNNMATFKPATTLAANVLYTATITNMVKNKAGIAMANNFVWTFTTGDGPDNTPPTVISTVPVNLATEVTINTKPTATFSEAMDPLTINSSTFTVKQGVLSVAGSVTYVGTVATFKPFVNFTANTTYTATITSGVEDVAGNAMVSNYVWTFSTGTGSDDTPPKVISTFPADLATGVPINTRPSAIFSEPMDPMTITPLTFTIKQGNQFISGSVSYVGLVATFKPSTGFIANKVYTATITTGAEDLAGNAMINNYIWTFTTGTGIDLIPPTVVSTVPANLATEVLLSVKPAATFSELMDPLTINASTYTLKQGTTLIPGLVSYNGLIATFSPTNVLLANTTYTATITTGVKDLAGNAMANNYVWIFTTGIAVDIIPPTVVSTVPANLATEVQLNVKPAATFSELMDPLTINASTYTLKQGTTLVPGLVSYNGLIGTFTPTNDLLANTIYTATITTGVKDLAGNAMVNNNVWTFTTLAVSSPTVISTDPANMDTDIALNKIVTATFSEPMDPLTITGTTFTIQNGSSSVTGVISYNGTTASFAPSADLLPNTLYTGTITTEAMSAGGTPLAANYTWTFTTVSLMAPTVISTDPMDLDIDVPLNQIISADFSEVMNSSTITTSTFTLMQGTNSISGLVDYSGTTATLTPSGDLLSNTTYTATITTGAENLSGTPLDNDYVWTFTTQEIVISIVDLGTAAAYGAFGGNAGITNQGINTIINGGIATTAASTLVTGFHDGMTGDVYTETPLNVGLVTDGIFTAPPFPGTTTNEAIATQALIDANAAYISISPAIMPGGIDPGVGELGGLTLAPGVYMSESGTFNISNGPLTLDAQGDPNATWVFQTAAGLTVGIAGPTGARSIVLTNGALPKNVFWYVGSSATINAAGGGTMVGTIIATAGVTFSTPDNMDQTVLNGRAISLVASVTMVNTTINVPAP
ncbi:MAG: Ig-like domain-containing protein [Bacteroidales bacterium]|nr:Ig-like domain-containing protein [Bacteroidales bacterium]